MPKQDFSEDLARLFESDDAHLFQPKEKPKGLTADDRLAMSFQEITNFVTEHNRQPEINSEDIEEALLAKRLESLKYNPDKVCLLEPYDPLGPFNSSKGSIQC